MLLNLERLDLLIAHYTAGCLPEPAHVLVGSHLEMQPQSGRLAGQLDALAGAALEATRPSELSNSGERLNAIFRSRHPDNETAPASEFHGSSQHGSSLASRLGYEDNGDLDDEQTLPNFLRGYAGRRLADVPWKTKLPGLKHHVIEKNSGMEASLLWARPGRALPHHHHRGLELTLVLKGAFHDHRGAFEQGAVSVADETIVHRPVADKASSCLCFSVLLAPISLSGSTVRIVADILGL